MTSLSDDESRELYIRWVQLSAFLPVMEFSYLPFDNQTVLSVVQSMTALHSRLVSDQSFQDALSDAVEKSFPIVRPIWWLADSPNKLDAQLFTITNQFLIGDRIMAAPILTHNCTSRSVYFPKGTSWRVESPVSQVGRCKDNRCSDGRTLTFDVLLNETLYFSST